MHPDSVRQAIAQAGRVNKRPRSGLKPPVACVDDELSHDRLRILIIHNYYQQRGGEDAVAEEEVEALRAHGHDVHFHSVSNTQISNPIQNLLAFLFTPFNPFAYREIFSIAKTYKPDIAHIHNFFPLLSPSIFYALRRLSIPTVFTLHNFRILCPTATLFYDNAINERSLKHSPWWTVRARAYRGSMIASFAVAAMVALHKRLNTWNTKVDRLIPLTDFARRKFIEGGIAPGQLTVKGNSAAVLSVGGEGTRHGAVYVGRLTVEKGVETLVAAWRGLDYPLRIVGDGALADHPALKDNPNIVRLGHLSRADVAREILASAFLVLPSQWYEMFPMVILEAFSQGTPIIAANIGGLATLVRPGVDGLQFASGDSADLRRQLEWAIANPDEMRQLGIAAHQVYAQNYTPERNYESLMAMYRSVLGNAA